MKQLKQALVFLQTLTTTINDSDSSIWIKVTNAMQRIEDDHNFSKLKLSPYYVITNTLFQSKQSLVTDNIENDSIEHIIKWLLFYGYHCWFRYDLVTILPGNREQFIIIIESLIQCSCISFQRFDLLPPNFHPDPAAFIYWMVLRMEFADKCGIPQYTELFWNAFCLMNMKSFDDGQKAYHEARLGIIMMFGTKYIEEELRDVTDGAFEEIIVSVTKLISNYSDRYKCKSSVDVEKVVKQLKNWRNKINKSGKMLLFNGYNNGPKPMSGLDFIIGKVLFIDKRYKLAKRTLCRAIYSANSFIILSVSLRYLSKTCEILGEYGMSLNALKCVHKICCIDNKAYMTPSFIEGQYDKNKKLLRKKLNKMKCKCCGMKKRKLKSCTGCMKVMYCDKKCQRRHWNLVHRYHCDRSWYKHYVILKHTIVFK